MVAKWALRVQMEGEDRQCVCGGGCHSWELGAGPFLGPSPAGPLHSPPLEGRRRCPRCQPPCLLSLSSPELLGGISDQRLRWWAQELNAKWKVLGRKVSGKDPRPPPPPPPHTRMGGGLVRQQLACVPDQSRGPEQPRALLPDLRAKPHDGARGAIQGVLLLVRRRARQPLGLAGSSGGRGSCWEGGGPGRLCLCVRHLGRVFCCAPSAKAWPFPAGTPSGSSRVCCSAT